MSTWKCGRQWDDRGIRTAELVCACRKDAEAVIAKRHLSAESCGHRRIGRSKLDWLDFMTDALTITGVRNSRRRQIKVKQSHCRSGHALRVPEVRGSHFSRQSAHEGGRVVRPTHRSSLPPGNIPSTHFCYRLSQP